MGKRDAWTFYPNGGCFCVTDEECYTGTEQALKNTEFIAHSREDIHYLLALAREAERIVKAFEDYRATHFCVISSAKNEHDQFDPGYLAEKEMKDALSDFRKARGG